MPKRNIKFQIIARRLSTHQLRRLRDSDLSLTYDELLGKSPEERTSIYFLGYYSPAGIELALKKYGLFNELRKRGFDNFKTVVDTRDPYHQRLAVYYERKDPDHLLGEVVLKRKHITVYPPFPSPIHGRTFEVLSVEWMCLQNPREKFTPDRPRLPGQRYPGLGLGKMVLEILLIACGRLRLAGLYNVPEHFHNAQIYSREFIYLNPECEGRRRAIVRDLMGKYNLAEISWAIDLGCVLENGEPFQWFVGEQIIPLNRDLKEYFKDKHYREIMEKAYKTYRYSLDEKCWAEKKLRIEELISC